MLGDLFYAEIIAGEHPTRLIVMRSVQSWSAEVWDLGTSALGPHRVWGPVESSEIEQAKLNAEEEGRKYAKDYESPIEWYDGNEVHIRVS